MLSGDGSMHITILNAVKFGPSENNGASPQLELLEKFKKIDDLNPPGWKPIGDFSTKEIVGRRLLAYRIYRMDPTRPTIAAVYYLAGPGYIVTFTVASTRSIDATHAVMEPIFGSLNWLGR
jgi:hypothetical protein